MNKSRLKYASLLSPLLLALCVVTCAAGTEDSPAEAVEIRVKARQFSFEPKTITVRKGDHVKLIIQSEDVAHGFAIDEFKVSKKIAPNQETVIEFTPDREGRFRFYCSVYCGDDHDKMVGELIVTESQGAAGTGVQVRFDQNSPGVVIVESGGERIRIDTAAKTVSRISEPGPAAPPPPTTSHRSEQHEARQAAREPYDYRLVNVPTPKRVPRHSFNVYFTHRFSKPVHQDRESFGETFEELFGLDSFSVSSLGFTYGITDRLYTSVYRSPICQPSAICKTIEIGLGYHLLDEGGRSPLALSAYGSVEGADNFTEHFTYNLQAMVARSVTKYVNLFFSPAVHINSNGQGRFNPRPENFFPPEPLTASLKLGQHTGSFGFGVNARVRPSASLLFEYTPRVGFKLGQVEPIFDSSLKRIGLRNRSEAEIGFGIEKRIGRHSFSLTFSNTQATTTSRYNSSNLVLPPSKVILGFNLFRRLL